MQTFVRSPSFCAFIFRLSWVHWIFECSLDFRALVFKFSHVHLIFVRSCSDFRGFARIPWVHVQNIIRTPDFSLFTQFSGVHVQTFFAFTRLFCAPKTFVRWSYFGATTPLLAGVQIQTFVQSPKFRVSQKLNASGEKSVKEQLV